MEQKSHPETSPLTVAHKLGSELLKLVVAQSPHQRRPKLGKVNVLRFDRTGDLNRNNIAVIHRNDSKNQARLPNVYYYINKDFCQLPSLPTRAIVYASMANALPIIQLVLSVLLIGLILLQRPVTDSGALSGGESSSSHVKRGLEKTIYQLTILVSLGYIAASLAVLLF